MLLLSEKVLKVIEHEGIALETAQAMVAKSALSSTIRGNRRYHDWTFLVTGDRVVDMCRFELTKETRETIGDPFRINEACPQCESEGCPACGWVGLVQVEYQ